MKNIYTLLAAAVFSMAQAQQVTVHHAPGGVSDRASRTLAQQLSWPVKNMPGAGGRIAMRAVMKEPSIVIVTVSQIFVTNALSSVVQGYDTDRLDIIAVIGHMPTALVCNRAHVSSWSEFNQKQRVSMAVAGLGSNEHVSTVVLQQRVQAELTVVPYAQGGSSGIRDVIAGHVQCTMGNWPTVMPYIEHENLVLLAVSSAIPNVPKDMVLQQWPYQGILAVVSADTQLTGDERLKVKAAVLMKAVQQQWQQQGLTVQVQVDTEAQKAVVQHTDYLKNLITTHNIKLE